MYTSISGRQLRLGAALLAATILPLAMSPALAESSATRVATYTPQASTRHVAESRQQGVPYGDLDLKTVDGFATLNKRIAVAVRNVCMRSDPNAPGGMRKTSDCRKGAQQRATADVQNLDGAALFGTE